MLNASDGMGGQRCTTPEQCVSSETCTFTAQFDDVPEGSTCQSVRRFVRHVFVAFTVIGKHSRTPTFCLCVQTNFKHLIRQMHSFLVVVRRDQRSIRLATSPLLRARQHVCIACSSRAASSVSSTPAIRSSVWRLAVIIGRSYFQRQRVARRAFAI